MSRKKQKISGMHTHMLLWNLRAMENSAAYAPEQLRDEYIAKRDELAPQYRAELDKRGAEYPKTLDDADWEIALARALGFDEPQPRKVGRKDTASGKMMQLTEVWDAARRTYVIRQ